LRLSKGYFSRVHVTEEMFCGVKRYGLRVHSASRGCEDAQNNSVGDTLL